MGYIGQSFAVFSLLGSGFVHFRAVHQAAGSLVGSGQQASGPSLGQDIWPGRGGCSSGLAPQGREHRQLVAAHETKVMTGSKILKDQGGCYHNVWVDQ